MHEHGFKKYFMDDMPHCHTCQVLTATSQFSIFTSLLNINRPQVTQNVTKLQNPPADQPESEDKQYSDQQVCKQYRISKDL